MGGGRGAAAWINSSERVICFGASVCSLCLSLTRVLSLACPAQRVFSAAARIKRVATVLAAGTPKPTPNPKTHPARRRLI